MPGPHVVGVDVGRRAAVARSAGQRNDEEVLEDAPGVAGPDGAGRLPLHRLAQIDTAVVAERGDQLTVLRVHGDDVAALQVDEPAVGSIGTLPVVHPARARGRRAFLAPDLLAGRRIDRGERAAPDRGVHHAVDDDGIEDAVAGDGKAPGHLELRHVLLVDLIERGVLRGMRTARIGLPGRVGLCRAHDRCRAGRACPASVASAIATASPVRETIPPTLRMR